MPSSYDDNIQKLYIAYFNRPVDIDGLNAGQVLVVAPRRAGKTHMFELVSNPKHQSKAKHRNDRAYLKRKKGRHP